MSLSQLPNIQNLNLNDASLGSNGQSNTLGSYANLTFSNDLVPNLQNVPSATFTLGLGASNDPNYPNSLNLSVATNNPTVSPSLGVIAFAPTEGGNIGNGTLTVVEGDLSCEGDVYLSVSNASSLATDNNGKIIVGSGSGGYVAPYKWALGNAIFTDNTFTSGGNFTSKSSAIIDPNTGIVSIFLNIGILNSTAKTNVIPNFYVDTNSTWTPSATGTLPPPNQAFRLLTPNNNTITTFAGINLCNITANPISVLADNFYMAGYFVNAGLFSISSLQSVSIGTAQTIIYSGVFQYPYL